MRATFYEIVTKDRVIHLIRNDRFKDFVEQVIGNDTYTYRKVRREVEECWLCGSKELKHTLQYKTIDGCQHEICSKCFREQKYQEMKYCNTLPKPKYQKPDHLGHNDIYVGQIYVPIRLLGIKLYDKVLDVYGVMSWPKTRRTLFGIGKDEDWSISYKYPRQYNKAVSMWNMYCDFSFKKHLKLNPIEE